MHNAYAKYICAGKIKDPSGLNTRKDFKDRKPAMVGGMMKRSYMGGGRGYSRLKRQGLKKGCCDSSQERL